MMTMILPGRRLTTTLNTVIAALCGSVVSLYNDFEKGGIHSGAVLLPLILYPPGLLAALYLHRSMFVGVLISTTAALRNYHSNFSSFVIVRVFDRSRAVVVGVSGYFSLVLFSHHHCCCLFVNSTLS